MIDSEEYREGTYEKLDNRYPLGVLEGDLGNKENRKGMTGYLWYNGSTSFVDGEKLKWKHEDKVKARKKIPRRFP